MKLVKFLLFLNLVFFSQNRILQSQTNTNEEDYDFFIQTPEQIEISQPLLENESDNQSQLRQHLEEAMKQTDENSPVAVDPVIVRQIIKSLTQLLYNNKFPPKVEEDDFETDMKRENGNFKKIMNVIIQDEQKNAEIKLLKNKIKDIKTKVGLTLLHFHNGDDKIIEGYEKEIQKYQNELDDLRNNRKEIFKSEDSRNKFVEDVENKIQILEQNIKKLIKEISKMEKDSESNLLIEEKKQILELYQILLKSFLQEKMNFIEIEKLEKKRDKILEQVQSFEKLLNNVKDQKFIDETNQKLKELYAILKEINDELKKRKEISDLEKFEQEKIEKLEDEVNKFQVEDYTQTDEINEVVKTEEKIQNLDELLVKQSQENSIPLKYKLDTNLNPMISNLQGVLDEDYQNTDDIHVKITDENQTLSNYHEIKIVQKSLVEVIEMVKNIQGEQNHSKENVKTMINSELFDFIKNFSQIFGENKEKIRKNFDQIKKFTQDFDSQTINYLYFYSVKEEYDVVMKYIPVDQQDKSQFKQDVDTFQYDCAQKIEHFKEKFQYCQDQINTLENIDKKVVEKIGRKRFQKKNKEIEFTDEETTFLIEKIHEIYDQMKILNDNLQDTFDILQDIQDQRDYIEHEIQREQEDQEELLERNKQNVQKAKISRILSMIFIFIIIIQFIKQNYFQ